MKALYLVSSDGAFRRASSSQIADVLEGRTPSKIARMEISDDGDATPIALTDAELDELRDGLAQRRDAELAVGLDHHLAAMRRLDTITGVSTWGTSISIDIGEAPWAEQAVRDWAARNALTMKDDPPSNAERWTRTAKVDLGPEAWARTLVMLTWPTVSIVARDAELDGRTTDAAQINAEAF